MWNVPTAESAFQQLTLLQKTTRKMKWKSVNERPQTTESIQVLLASFDGNILKSISRGWFFADPDGDGFFAPNRNIHCTHWMPYEEYWEVMQSLERL